MRRGGHVVPTTEEDVSAWLLLAAEAEELFEAPMSTDPSFADGLRKSIARGTAFCVRNGDPAGPLLGGITWSPTKREISWLAVARAARGRGIARRLIDRVVTEARPGGLSVVTFTADSNEGRAARGLYEAMGFVDIGEDTTWLPHRRDRFILGPVTVEKRKWPTRTVSTWQAEILGRDEHGVWLLSRKGQTHRLADGEEWIVPCDGVQLLPVEGMWVAWWWRDGWIGVDIATPPAYSQGTYSYIDLELDLVFRDDGQAELLDMDELSAAVDSGALPLDIADLAKRAAESLLRRHPSSPEPFGTVGWARLASVGHSP